MDRIQEEGQETMCERKSDFKKIKAKLSEVEVTEMNIQDMN